MRGDFFYNGKNGRKKTERGRKGREKDGDVELNDDGETTFFVLRATARCTKRVSIYRTHETFDFQGYY